MSFTGFLTTEKGKILLTKLLSGEKLLFTRVAAGSGLCLTKETAQHLNDLICPEMEGTSTVPSFLDGVVGLTVEFRSDMLTGNGFSLSEYGIFALDPDEGEILLYYTSLGENPQFLTGNTGHYATVLRFDVSIAVDDDFGADVELSYPAWAFVRHEEMGQAFLAHNEDLSAHEGLFGAIVDELEGLESGFSSSLEELENNFGKEIADLESGLAELETKDHKHDTSDLTSGVLPLVRGGTGNAVGQAVTANALTTARNLSVNLGSTWVASFNGSENAVLGVSGVLPVVNGGTGETSLYGLKEALGVNILEGLTTNANNDGQTSLGYDTVVSSCYPTALGHRAKATADCSIGIGYNTAASGGFSTVVGGDSTGDGHISTAIGYNSTASGYCSSALGYYSKALGDFTVALGHSAKSSSAGATAIGETASASGGGSVALGYYSSATGENSCALGYHAVATGEGYFQIGNSNYTSVVRIATTSLTTTSDKRDKTDISPVSDSLEFLSKIQPMGYVMNYRSTYEEDFFEELEILEKKEKRISKNQEKIQNSQVEEILIDTENTSEIETFTLEEKNRLNSLKERKRKRNTYGRGDYDRESHKKGEKKGKRRRIGVLAQDVQQAMLEQYGTDNYADLVIDNLYEVEDVPEGMESSLGVNYSNFIPFLIDGVNRLNGENQRLSRENQDILQRLETLEELLQ